MIRAQSTIIVFVVVVVVVVVVVIILISWGITLPETTILSVVFQIFGIKRKQNLLKNTHTELELIRV